MSPSAATANDTTLTLLEDAAARYRSALSASPSQEFAEQLDHDYACSYLWERMLDCFLDSFPQASGGLYEPAPNRETAQEALVDWYKRWTTENTQ